MMSLHDRVRRAIERDALLPPGSRVVVAVSGGSDSVALLELLVDLAPTCRFTIAALAHVNHGLRGADSDDDEEETAMATDEELREQAIKAIKKKRDFWGHVVAYCIVNAFLIILWYFNGRGYFWPGWVLGGWGIGLAFNAWDAYGRGSRPISEDEIQREIDKRR